MHAPRHARDYERLIQHSESLITRAADTLMTRRITRRTSCGSGQSASHAKNKPEDDPTVVQGRRRDHTGAWPAEPLDASWLRQLCLDAGADDGQGLGQVGGGPVCGCVRPPGTARGPAPVS